MIAAKIADLSEFAAELDVEVALLTANLESHSGSPMVPGGVQEYTDGSWSHGPFLPQVAGVVAVVMTSVTGTKKRLQTQ